MNFVEVSPINPLSLVILMASIASMVVGISIYYRSSSSYNMLALLGGLMLFGGMFGFCLGMVSLSGIPLSKQKAQVGEQIEEIYGLKLTEAELVSLDYPAEEPEGDFEVFGSFFQDQRTEDGFERTEVFLIWRDGEMVLAGSPDGETFTELKR